MAARSRFAVPLALALCFPLTAHCAQGSVYGPSAPGDSAFVRLVNAVSGSKPLALSLGATRFEALAYKEVSPYRPVVPDIYLVRGFGRELEIVARTRTYFTVVFTPRGIRILEDPTHVDPARAQVFLYNVSSLPQVDLASADGKTRLIEGVRPDSSKQIVVNAVRASLAVVAGSAVVKQIGDIGLGRGASFSVFVVDTDVFVVKAEVRN